MDERQMRPQDRNQTRSRCSPELLRRAARLAYEATEWPPTEKVDGPLVFDLYGGELGACLLHAVMASHWPDPAEPFRQRALTALEPYRQAVEDTAGSGPQRPAGVGGLIGVGALIYTLAVAGELLDELELVQQAVRAAGWLTDQALGEDHRFDIVHGSAGALLALLAVDSICRRCRLASDSAFVLARAQACGEFLLARRRGEPPLAWAQPRGQILSGFAHGAAGISNALLRLGQRLDTAAFTEAALTAERFENGLYVEERCNWRAYHRQPESESSMMAWCYGAPGIALGRLAGLRPQNLEALQGRGLARAIQATCAYPQTRTDHLCCGNLGRAWILAQSAERLGVAKSAAGADMAGLACEAALRADQLTYDVLRRYKARGRFGLDGGAATLGLLKGTPGICLGLLGQASPATVPFLLALEPPAARSVPLSAGEFGQ